MGCKGGAVTGYRIYYGTIKGSYPNMVEVGNDINHIVEGLDDGVTYYFVVRAYNDQGESGNSNIVQWPLYVTISNPSSNLFSTEADTLDLSGTAHDELGVILVSWENNQGGSGDASGTSQWSANVTLHCGQDNVVTVTAHDADGNISAASVTIDVKPCPVTIITP